jgi:hypothetical protein
LVLAAAAYNRCCRAGLRHKDRFVVTQVCVCVRVSVCVCACVGVGVRENGVCVYLCACVHAYVRGNCLCVRSMCMCLLVCVFYYAQDFKLFLCCGRAQRHALLFMTLPVQSTIRHIILVILTGVYASAFLCVLLPVCVCVRACVSVCMCVCMSIPDSSALYDSGVCCLSELRLLLSTG